MSNIRINDIDVYYERHGAGEPLLWIGGLGANLTEIPYLVESYNQHFDFIVYDQRGCGRSDKPAGDFSMALFADDAAALLDALGIESAFVYGSSMGGMVAQELVLRHPHKVRALALGCTTPGAVRGARPTPETVQKMIYNQTLSGDEALEAGWSLGYSAEYIESHRDALFARSREASKHTAPRESYMRQVIAAAQHDTHDRLGEITCPVLILHGDCDLMMPVENAYMLKKGMPHAELRILQGMGHGYNLEAQAEADAILIDFFERHTAARPDARQDAANALR